MPKRRNARKDKGILVVDVLRKHFRKAPLESLMSSSRFFPVTSRVDLQYALEKVMGERFKARLLGVNPEYSHETLAVSHLVAESNFPVRVGPMQYEEVDIGDELPARCLKLGLWLAEHKKTQFIVLASRASRYEGMEGVRVEIAVPPGEQASELSSSFLSQIEDLVRKTGSYRGKVLSLEMSEDYRGLSSGIKVHKLHSVDRKDVILPEKTLRLLENNITGFIENRARLKELGMAVKKGLLFHGPPGTGKTHTLYYLASQLKDHTTLIITAEQVGQLDRYFQLARFLQPSMLVIEDIDLIARSRDELRGICDEATLNKLLNEMDGLREDAEILFILTTNHPEKIEAALAARPGRIDQAILFPLPDDECRRRLVGLYSYGLELDTNVVGIIVAKTEGASAAFIKELMRRSAQFMMRDGNKGALAEEHVESALEEMLFASDSLNAKLLGARGTGLVQ